MWKVAAEEAKAKGDEEGRGSWRKEAVEDESKVW
jgi:hypothetical protein